MQKGACVISIDYEYAWGNADRAQSEEELARVRSEAAVTESLLSLFERYRIPATWAIVGKLLEPREEDDVAWTDTKGLIGRIKDSPAGHEIGSHSYAHIFYDAATPEEAARDLDAAKRLHEARGLLFRSFIFPRNREAHHALLKERGIQAFRGQSRQWYHFLPYPLWALGRGIDYWLPTARTVVPRRHESGILNIPDSLLLVSRKGIQKLLPPSQAVRKFRWGLRAAARQNAIFHLWFHPSNFSYDTGIQLVIFERMLVALSEMRDQGEVEVMTMGDCAQRYEHA